MQQFDMVAIRDQFEERGYNLISKECKGKLYRLDYICNKHPDKIQQTQYLKFLEGQGCFDCGIAENAVWTKTGAEINDYLRKANEMANWRCKWLETTNGKCAVCNKKRKGKIHVHHSIPHHQIRDEVLLKLNLPFKKYVNEYSEDELKLILSLYLELHKEIVGIPMLKGVHKLFHNLYGINANYEDYLKFKERWNNGEFK